MGSRPALFNYHITQDPINVLVDIREDAGHVVDTASHSAAHDSKYCTVSHQGTPEITEAGRNGGVGILIKGAEHIRFGDMENFLADFRGYQRHSYVNNVRGERTALKIIFKT